MFRACDPRPLAVAIAIAIASVGPSLAAPASAPSDPPAAVLVQTTKPARQVVKDRIKVFGAVTTAQDATSDIGFQHAGQVARIDVQPGEAVKAGTPLVELTTDPAAALSYRNAQATTAFAQRDLDRTKTLLAQHLATNAQVATAQKALADAQAALATERSLGNDKSRETVGAPTDGFVAAIQVAVGDRIAANTTVVKLTRTDVAARVTVGLEPDVARRVQPGMVAMVAPVYASGEAPAIHGTVQGIAAIVDPATHLVNAFVALPMGAAPLAPGVSIAVTIIAAQHDGVAVPRSSVLQDDKGAYLFAVAGGVAHRIAVQTGIQTDKTTELLGGVDLAMQVVTSGNYELKDGMAVRTIAASAAKP